MTTWCVDPGAVASGLASLDRTSTHAYWDQFTDPVELYRFLYGEWSVTEDVLLVEDYSHGGAFTSEAKQTIEIIGFIYNSAMLDQLQVHRVHKDKRLSGQGPAARLMGDTIETLKKDPRRKDAFSALSHCVVWNR